MDAEALIGIRERAVSFYQVAYKNFKDEAEDFGSWLVEKVIEGKYSIDKLNIRWASVDYLREVNGRKTQDFVDIREKLNHHLESRDHENRGELKLKERHARLISEITKFDLENEHRAIALLYWQYGFSGNEIAHLFGVTPSRVSQKIKEITTRLKKEVDPAYAQIVLQERTLRDHQRQKKEDAKKYVKKMRARAMKYHGKNRDEILAKRRLEYANKRSDLVWVESEKLRHRKRRAEKRWKKKRIERDECSLL